MLKKHYFLVKIPNSEFISASMFVNFDKSSTSTIVPQVRLFRTQVQTIFKFVVFFPFYLFQYFGHAEFQNLLVCHYGLIHTCKQKKIHNFIIYIVSENEIVEKMLMHCKCEAVTSGFQSWVSPWTALYLDGAAIEIF